MTAAPHLGDLYAVASTVCFAASNITVARGARRGGDDNGAFLSLITTTLVAGGGWILLGMLRGFEAVTWLGILWFVGAGLFTMFVGRVFFYSAIEHLGAMRASTTKRLIPFFSVMLGVGLLGERLTGGMVAGMLLIVASFAVLVRSATRSARPEAPHERGFNVGYLYGPVSALGYALGYVLRKMGLADAHDALLGAAVGCLAAVVLFVATAAFNDGYARAVRSTFSRPNPWLVAAGVLSSGGQIFYFMALGESPMARVALVSSVEVFVTL
ncbi:MAG TPA: DMT family transporter, partial [Usitatibacter sp.]|nr:DMT family transporter [Usitatibacter sp.]